MSFDDDDVPYVEPDAEVDALAHAVIGAAIEVHRHLGPGLDEALYQNALKYELHLRNIPYAVEVVIDAKYKGQAIGQKRIDLLVAGRLVIELKAVEKLSPLHSAQLHTYLKLMGLKLGILINFNSILLKDGLKRVIRS